MRKISESSIEFPCPKCSAVDNHRSVSSPTIQPLNPDNESFEYRVEKGLEKAKNIRNDHEAQFGTYEDWMGDRAKHGSQRSISMDQIEMIGADEEFIKNFENKQTEEAKNRQLVVKDLEEMLTPEEREMLDSMNIENADDLKNFDI
jgi:hypothetical protein